MTTIEKRLIEISKETLQEAKSRIQEMVNSRKLVINGTISETVPVVYPSQNKKKEFRRILSSVIHHPTMKNANVFLHKLSKYTGESQAKVDYSAKEKEIRKSREEWKEALKKALELQAKYKETKGNFYK